LRKAGKKFSTKYWGRREISENREEIEVA
jgi:hypothetical protein